MKFANINLVTFRTSEQTNTASPEQLAAWLRLIALASEQKNGGVLKGAVDWKEHTARHWLKFGGRDLLFEMVEVGLLITADGSNDLHVFSYDTNAEAAYIAMCKGGQKSAKRRRQIKEREQAAAYEPEDEPFNDTEVVGISPKTRGGN